MIRNLVYKIIFVLGIILALITGKVLGRFLVEDAFQAYPGVEGSKLLYCLCNTKDFSTFALPVAFFVIVSIIGLISIIEERSMP